MEGIKLTQMRKARGYRTADDVHTTLKVRAAETGEPMEDILDRALRRELGMATPPRYSIEPITEKLALCVPDWGESIRPIPAQTPYLEIDTRDGKMRIDTRMNSEYAVPMVVWNGIVRRFDLTPTTDGVKLTADINSGKLDEVIGRVVDGSSVKCDGNNYVGVASDDATDAEEELRSILAGYHVDSGGLWDAGAWVGDVGEITVQTTDDEIEDLARKIEREA